MKIQVNGYTVEIDVDPDVKTGLSQLGIDVDKEIHQGIEQGLSDGPAMVSTGIDIEDGNTVGDDCKSSKISKCKNIYFQVHASER